MDKYQGYVIDICSYIKTRALEAVAERNKTNKGTHGRSFQDGRVIGFNEVVSLLKQHAEGFGIPLEELSLKDIEPDNDLI